MLLHADVKNDLSHDSFRVNEIFENARDLLDDDLLVIAIKLMLSCADGELATSCYA